MTTTSSASTIKELSKALLAAPTKDLQVKAIIDQFHAAFHAAIGLSGTETNFQHNLAVNTEYGKALGLTHAAQCLIDYHRTHLLFLGLYSAIREKQTQHPGKQIQIFYAGCGPYAPLVTLIAPLFETSELRFSVLDINPESLAYAKDLIEKMGLSAHIHEYYQADAITFKVPNAKDYDILFSETLDALLFRECYVPILCNMIPKFQEEIIVIPENVQIKMSFIRKDDEGNETEDAPVIVFDSRETAKSAEKMGHLPDSFEPKRVPIDRNSNIVALVLDTEVHVYNALKLFRAESALTRSYAMGIDPNVPFNHLVFTYFLKPQVELFTGTETL